ncbi:hypothetical protein C8R46DRAFT_1232830 [Mycena filopes]|nr:hypothetical protein C8R46DRAFT_1232830 [Mycena filopes]
MATRNTRNAGDPRRHAPSPRFARACSTPGTRVSVVRWIDLDARKKTRVMGAVGCVYDVLDGEDVEDDEGVEDEEGAKDCVSSPFGTRIHGSETNPPRPGPLSRTLMDALDDEDVEMEVEVEDDVTTKPGGCWRWMKRWGLERISARSFLVFSFTMTIHQIPTVTLTLPPDAMEDDDSHGAAPSIQGPGTPRPLHARVRGYKRSTASLTRILMVLDASRRSGQARLLDGLDDDDVEVEVENDVGARGGAEDSGIRMGYWTRGETWCMTRTFRAVRVLRINTSPPSNTR